MANVEFPQKKRKVLKRHSLLTLFGFLFVAAGILCLLFSFQTLPGGSFQLTFDIFNSYLGHLPDLLSSYFQGFFGLDFASGVMGVSSVAVFNLYAGLVIGVLAVVIVVLWIITLIVFIARKRPSVIWTWIVSFVSMAIGLLAVLSLFESNYVIDYFLNIGASFTTDLLAFHLIHILGMLLTLVGLILAFVALCTGIHDCRVNPGTTKKAIAHDEALSKELAYTPQEVTDEDLDALKAAQYEELTNKGTPVTPDNKAATAPIVINNANNAPTKPEEEKKVTPEPTATTNPYIVQNIYYAGAMPENKTASTNEVAPNEVHHYHHYDELKKEEKIEEKPVVAPAPQPVPAPTPIDESNRPLTARELRSIIQEALDDHDHPDNDKPLTDDEARKLIREELDSYYARSYPEFVDDDEDYEEEESLTSEDLRSIIREELAMSKETPAPKEEPVVESTKEEAVAPAPLEEKTEKAPETEEKTPSLTVDDIRSIMAEEFARFREESKAREEALANARIEAEKEAALRKQEAEDARIRAEADRKALAIKEQEEKERAEEEARLAEKEAQRRIDDAQTESIEALKNAMVKPEDIRAIIADELSRKIEELKAMTPVPEVREEPEVAPAPVEPEVKPEAAPAPAPAVMPQIIVNVPPAPAPVVVEKEVKTEVKEPVEKPKIIRIPFPTRLLSSEQELKDNYNELKAECLSYGLKSRLSNSGDTFRLHTKTYVKITVAGKGLKLYLALDPKDYENSPIPVKDAGDKNIYREIPVVFKVKSPLSMKRAKQLIADACECDDLEQGKVINKDYASELVDYKPQNASGKDEDDVEDEE